nr:MAG TPA: hypothetical protein [Caudoviricetes sp.]
MERLTERYKDSIANIVLITECGDKLCKDICDDIECDCSKCGLEKALEKLAEYEDLEEQGLLVRLPVSIGTKVYMIASMFDCVYDYDNCKAIQKWKCEEDIQCEYEKKSYYVKEIEFISIMKDSIGKSIFLTREEAEKKLEEMKN